MAAESMNHQQEQDYSHQTPVNSFTSLFYQFWIPNLHELKEEHGLKRLGFIQIIAIHTATSLMSLYICFKEKAGPLKPTFEHVEGTVKTVVAPIYSKISILPMNLLVIIDRKAARTLSIITKRVRITVYVLQIDDSLKNMDHRMPGVMKQLKGRANFAGAKDAAAGMARRVYLKCEPKAKELLLKYEPYAEKYAASAWRKLNQLPVFPRIASVVVPAVASCAEKYNEIVTRSAAKGYTVASFMPLVPTQKIAKVFN